jgi:hypothetical protein
MLDLARAGSCDFGSGGGGEGQQLLYVEVVGSGTGRSSV